MGIREAHLSGTAERAPTAGGYALKIGAQCDVPDEFIYRERVPLFPKTEHVGCSTCKTTATNLRKFLYPPPRRRLTRRIR